MTNMLFKTVILTWN